MFQCNKRHLVRAYLDTIKKTLAAGRRYPFWENEGMVLKTESIPKHARLLWNFATFHKKVFNSLFIQGPLNIWTEHSNCQIHGRGDSKTLIALLIPNIFLIHFMKLFFYAYETWNLIFFMSLSRIQWTQSFAFSELYSN